jgi:hypothetical protein
LVNQIVGAPSTPAFSMAACRSGLPANAAIDAVSPEQQRAVADALASFWDDRRDPPAD